MSDLNVATRYAEALIDVAAEAGAVDAVGADLNQLADLLAAHDGMLRAALCTPVFSADERRGVLAELLPKLSLQTLSNNFVHVLNDKGRLAALEGIARVYADLANERAGRVTVRATTAEPMTDATAAAVRDAMAKATGKQVVLKTEVDPDLLGGIVVRVGGTVYDASLRTRLNDLKHSLLHAGPTAEA